MKECAYGPCKREVKVKGLCTGHYQQLWRGIELKPLVRRRALNPVVDGYRKCNVCEEVKPLSAYYDRPSGARGECADCESVRVANRKRDRIEANRQAGILCERCTDPVDLKGLCTRHYMADWEAARKVSA